MTYRLFGCIYVVVFILVYEVRGRLLPLRTPRRVDTWVGDPAGSSGHTDGFRTTASFDNARDCLVTKDGGMFITEFGNCLIRRVTPDGTVTTVAGSGACGASVNGIGNAAQFNQPVGITTDGTNLFVVEYFLGTSLRVVTPGGSVTSVAAGYFNKPFGITIDKPNQNLFVSDRGGFKIFQIVIGSWLVSGYAGGGGQGIVDGAFPAAQFSDPAWLACDSMSNIFVIDSQAIRRLSSGQVKTIAGVTSGVPGYADGPALSAKFDTPNGIIVDRRDVVYVMDAGNNRLRMIVDGYVSTVGFSGTAGFRNGPLNTAKIEQSNNMCINRRETFLYIVSSYHVRRVYWSLNRTMSATPTRSPEETITDTQTGEITDERTKTVSISHSKSKSDREKSLTPTPTVEHTATTSPTAEHTTSKSPTAEHTTSMSPSLEKQSIMLNTRTHSGERSRSSSVTIESTATISSTISHSDSISMDFATHSRTHSETKDRTQTRGKPSKTKYNSRSRSTVEHTYGLTSSRSLDPRQSNSVGKRTVSSSDLLILKSRSFSISALPEVSYGEGRTPTSTRQLTRQSITKVKSSSISKSKGTKSRSFSMDVSKYTFTHRMTNDMETLTLTLTRTKDVTANLTLSVSGDYNPTTTMSRTLTKSLLGNATTTMTLTMDRTLPRTRRSRSLSREKSSSNTKSLFLAYIVVTMSKMEGDVLSNRMVSRPWIQLTLLGAKWRQDVDVGSFFELITARCSSKEVGTSNTNTTTTTTNSAGASSGSTGFERSRSRILQSSHLEYLEDGSVVRIVLGYDEDYKPECAEQLSIGDVSGLSHAAHGTRYLGDNVNFTLTIKPPSLLSSDLRTAVDTVATVATAASAMNVVGAASMQSMALMGSLSCMSTQTRSAAKSDATDFLMCPLCTIVDRGVTSHTQIVLYNVYLFLIVGMTHWIVTYLVREFTKHPIHQIRGTMMFPALSFTACSMFLQSTTVSAVKALSNGDPNVMASTDALSCLGLLVIPGTIAANVCIVRYVIQGETVPIDHNTSMLKAVLGPGCIWLPPEEASAYGCLYDYKPQHRYFNVKVYLYYLSLSIVTGLPMNSEDSCSAQLGGLCGVCWMLGFAYVIQRPLRTPILNLFRFLVLFLQGIVPLLNAVGTTSSLSLVPPFVFVLMGAIMLETVFVVISLVIELKAEVLDVIDTTKETNFFVYEEVDLPLVPSNELVEIRSWDTVVAPPLNPISQGFSLFPFGSTLPTQYSPNALWSSAFRDVHKTF